VVRSRHHFGPLIVRSACLSNEHNGIGLTSLACRNSILFRPPSLEWIHFETETNSLDWLFHSVMSIKPSIQSFLRWTWWPLRWVLQPMAGCCNTLDQTWQTCNLCANPLPGLMSNPPGVLKAAPCQAFGALTLPLRFWTCKDLCKNEAMRQAAHGRKSLAKLARRPLWAQFL